jgi:hypothetical protein
MIKGLVRAGSIIGVTTIAALAVGTSAADSAEPIQGSAYAAEAHVSLLKGILGPDGITVGTDKLAASNTSGPTSASTVDAALRGLVSAQALASSSTVDSSTGDVNSSAKIVGAALPVLRSVTGSDPKASVISSQCTSTSTGITGSSDLADLNLGRLGHLDASTPGAHVGVPQVVDVIANEHIHNADGSLTVNALHIKLLGGSVTGALGTGDIVLASSTCAAADTTPTTAPPTTAPPTDAPTTPPATAAPTTPAGGGSEPSASPSAPVAPSAPSAPELPTSSPTQAPPQTIIIPAGAPQTGDGTLATQIVR